MDDGRPFGNRMQLYCQNGYHLTIKPDGEVMGTEDDSDENSHIEITAGDGPGHVRLHGVSSNLYLCFCSDGKLYGECDPANEATVFVENFLGQYTTYASAVFPEWYVGIKKNGQPKPGHRTKLGQKATRFLPRRLT
nr:unnamed protein product [Callosobruchus chinensis]